MGFVSNRDLYFDYEHTTLSLDSLVWQYLFVSRWVLFESLISLHPNNFFLLNWKRKTFSSLWIRSPRKLSIFSSVAIIRFIGLLVRPSVRLSSMLNRMLNYCIFSVCTFTLHDLSLAHGVLGAFFCSSKISIFINNFLDMSIGGRTDGWLFPLLFDASSFIICLNFKNWFAQTFSYCCFNRSQFNTFGLTWFFFYI